MIADHGSYNITILNRTKIRKNEKLKKIKEEK